MKDLKTIAVQSSLFDPDQGKKGFTIQTILHGAKEFHPFGVKGRDFSPTFKVRSTQLVSRDKAQEILNRACEHINELTEDLRRAQGLRYEALETVGVPGDTGHELVRRDHAEALLTDSAEEVKKLQATIQDLEARLRTANKLAAGTVWTAFQSKGSLELPREHCRNILKSIGVKTEADAYPVINYITGV